MPLPSPRTEESTQEFVSRCMVDTTMQTEYPDREQRLAVCNRLESGEKATYNDYPKAATDNAKRALRIKEETSNENDCGTQVGWTRANQLASGESLSEDTIKRMASFNRHRQNSDGDPKEECGPLMWLAWGGDEGVDWAIAKSKEIDEQKTIKMEGLTHKLALAHIAMQVSANENAPADIASIAGIERVELAKMLSGEEMISEPVMSAMAEVLGMDESMFEAADMLDQPDKNEDQEEMKSLIKRKPKDSERKDDIGFQIKNIDLTSDAKYANIKGYGSVFGNVDLGGDVVVKGAFAKTLKDKGGKVPFLQDHKYDIDNFLGVITAEEDDYGLKSNIEVNLMTQKGREFYNKAKQCVEHGLEMGLSIGYDIMDSDMDQTMGVLKLKELRLNEISATLFPMNQSATITDVKSEVDSLKKELKSLKKSLQIEPSDDTHDGADLVKEIEQLRSIINNN